MSRQTIEEEDRYAYGIIDDHEGLTYLVDLGTKHHINADDIAGMIYEDHEPYVHAEEPIYQNHWNIDFAVYRFPSTTDIEKLNEILEQRAVDLDQFWEDSGSVAIEPEEPECLKGKNHEYSDLADSKWYDEEICKNCKLVRRYSCDHQNRPTTEYYRD